MAQKLVYVRYDYTVFMAPAEDIHFTARRRVAQEDGAVYCVRGDSLPKHLDRVMTGAEWQEMSDALFKELRIQEWERSYRPEEVCVSDGFQWRLMIALEDETKYEFLGENAVPERWEDLLEVFRPYFIELEALPMRESPPLPLDPVTGEPYPDVSENVWSRFDDDGYGIRDVVRPGKGK